MSTLLPVLELGQENWGEAVWGPGVLASDRLFDLIYQACPGVVPVPDMLDAVAALIAARFRSVPYVLEQLFQAVDPTAHPAEFGKE